MKHFLWILIIISVTISCNKTDENPDPAPPDPDPPEVDTLFYTGMDLSYQPFLFNYHVDYKDADGNSISNLLQFVKNNGVNLIRLRLFHNPISIDPVINNSNLATVVAYCEQVKQTGNDILLDIHFSDTWADPGSQTTPVAWENIDFHTINDSIYNYTKFVLNKLKARDALPVIVQIGNETNSGFLWDYGKVWNEFGDNWPNYITLMNSAALAIDEMETESGKEINSMIHIAGVVGAEGFFNKLKENGAQYDMIGLSYYHNFHSKDLDAVQNSLNQLANLFQKPIMLVETQYPFTLEWNDWTHNTVGLENQLIPGYPATPDGQKAYMENWIHMLKSIPNNLGKGFVWWAPDMVAFDGPESTNGSSRENLCAFDFQNQALPVFDVFKEN